MPNKIKCVYYDRAFFDAENFMMASKLITQKASNDLFTSDGIEKSIGLKYVSNVNHAYAIEIYLKCLMIIEKGEFIEGHDLALLFNNLLPETQKSIIDNFNANYKSLKRSKKYFGVFFETNFVEQLDEAKKAFIDFRYLFSKNSTPEYVDISLHSLPPISVDSLPAFQSKVYQP
jgi:HEPN domain-containing protein